jgi:hypothetical protein
MVKLGERAAVMAGRVLDADSAVPGKVFSVFLDGREILADGASQTNIASGEGSNPDGERFVVAVQRAAIDRSASA